MKRNPVPSKKAASTLGRRRIRFEVEAEPGRQVAVAGNFNAWNPESHQLKETSQPGHYERCVYLSPGKYEYKFVIDGTWSADPNCPTFSPNEFGTLNSVLNVQKTVAKSGRR